jgi:hypothetical protein
MEIIIIPIVVGIIAMMFVQLNSLITSTFKRRYLHRERISALEKGVPLPDELLIETEGQVKRPGNHMTAIGGIVWTGFGLGILLSRSVIDVSSIGSDFVQFMTFMSIWAFPALFIGIGLLVYAWLIRDRASRG